MTLLLYDLWSLPPILHELYRCQSWKNYLKYSDRRRSRNTTTLLSIFFSCGDIKMTVMSWNFVVQSVGEILDRGIIPLWGSIPWRIFIEIAPGATGQRILIYWRKYWMFSEEGEKAYKSSLQVEWVIEGLNVQTGIVITIHSFSIPGPVSIPFPIKIFMIRILIL